MAFRNGWAKYGFGKDLVEFSSSQPFIIDYTGATAHPTLTKPLDIAKEICTELYEASPDPLFLMVSGGVDSQAMAYAFKQSGVPVRYVIARYNNGINDHDIFSTSFFQDNDIPVEIIDLDIVDFHKRELLDWAVRYQNNSPHLLSHCKIASVLDGRVVSSGCIVTHQDLGQMNYSVFGLERYGKISGQDVTGFFFNYCPHLVHSTLGLSGPPTDLYAAKISVYHQAGFPVIAQTAKLHGFELLKKQFDDVEVPPSVRMRYLRHPSARPYDLLFRYPLIDAVPYSGLGSVRFY